MHAGKSANIMIMFLLNPYFYELIELYVTFIRLISSGQKTLS